MLKTVRILIIDDCSMGSGVLQAILSSVGHHVITVTNPTEGIERFKNSNFDMVFTDLEMPEMSGWDVVKAIKATDPCTPVVMLTGWGTNVDQDLLTNGGVDLVVAKPFTLDGIVSVVAHVTGFA
jgi:CheY-like chemotaxis protein